MSVVNSLAIWSSSSLYARNIDSCVIKWATVFFSVQVYRKTWWVGILVGDAIGYIAEAAKNFICVSLTGKASGRDSKDVMC